MNNTTLFLSIKNILIKYNSNFESIPIQENINIVNKAFNNNIIVILTSSRNLKFKNIIKTELEIFNIKYTHIIMEIPEGPRLLINYNEQLNNLNNSYAITLDSSNIIHELDKILLDKIIN